MAWEILVNYSTMYPTYSSMELAYEDYRINSKPAGAFPENQCAVRMSLALGRCGFSLDAFPERHRLQTRADLPVKIVLGAQELASYLKIIWGEPVVFRDGLASVSTILSGRKGIIYFNNCFHRTGDPRGVRRGDHIDLWNGSHYYNQLYHIPAGMEDHLSSGPLFNRSDRIWFFTLF